MQQFDYAFHLYSRSLGQLPADVEPALLECLQLFVQRLILWKNIVIGAHSIPHMSEFYPPIARKQQTQTIKLHCNKHDVTHNLSPIGQFMFVEALNKIGLLEDPKFTCGCVKDSPYKVNRHQEFVNLPLHTALEIQYTSMVPLILDLRPAPAEPTPVYMFEWVCKYAKQLFQTLPQDTIRLILSLCLPSANVPIYRLRLLCRLGRMHDKILCDCVMHTQRLVTPQSIHTLCNCGPDWSTGLTHPSIIAVYTNLADRDTFCSLVNFKCVNGGPNCDIGNKWH